MGEPASPNKTEARGENGSRGQAWCWPGNPRQTGTPLALAQLLSSLVQAPFQSFYLPITGVHVPLSATVNT